MGSCEIRNPDGVLIARFRVKLKVHPLFTTEVVNYPCIYRGGKFDWMFNRNCFVSLYEEEEVYRLLFPSS